MISPNDQAGLNIAAKRELHCSRIIRSETSTSPRNLILKIIKKFIGINVLHAALLRLAILDLVSRALQTQTGHSQYFPIRSLISLSVKSSTAEQVSLEGSSNPATIAVTNTNRCENKDDRNIWFEYFSHVFTPLKLAVHT